MPVFAVLSVIAFALALAFHLVGHGLGSWVVTAYLIGLLCVGLHLATGYTWALRHGPPA
jgi:hypothetical protein